MIDADCLIVNGDSYSAPHPKCAVYGNFLANHYEIPIHNFAVPGSSNDRILRSTVHYVEQMTKQNIHPFVILGWSFLHRLEVWYHGNDANTIAAAPDQIADHTQMRLVTANWIPNREVSLSTKNLLTSINTIEKKIIDWYLHIFLLAEFLEKKNYHTGFFLLRTTEIFQSKVSQRCHS
jgi:hypothetical protein